MKRFTDKRIIKQLSNNPLKHGKENIHPITLTINTNDGKNDIFPSQFWIENNDFKYYTIKKNMKSTNYSNNNMENPDLSLPLEDVLYIYNISTYDNLLQILKDMVDKNNTEHTIFRIVNLYTRIEFEELKRVNNTLIKIFKIIFKNKKLENDDFIKKFFKSWFDKHNKDDFKLNICIDFKKYLG